RERFRVGKPEDLTIREASQLIDQLKNAEDRGGELIMPTQLVNGAPRRRAVFDHLSFSAISLFQSCPLRFFFRYVLGLPEPTIAASLVLGSALHQAAQYPFAQFLAGES